MADDVIIQRLQLEGADQVKAQLDDIGRAGDKAGQQLSDAGSKAASGLGQMDRLAQAAADEIDKLSRSFGPLGKSVADAASSLLKVRGVLTGVAAAFGAVVVGKLVGGLVDVAKSAGEATGRLKEMATTAGTTATSFAGLAFAFEQSGSSAETLQRAMFAIGDAIGQAQDAGVRTQGVFERLNIQLRDTAGNARDPTQIFLEFSDALSKVGGEANKQTLAIQAFGRRIGPFVVEAASEGSAGLKAFAADFARLSGFTQDAADKGKAFIDAMSRVSIAADSFGNKLGEALQPSFTVAANALADALVNIREAFQPLFNSIGTVSTAVVDLIGAFERLREAVTNFTSSPLFSLLSPLGNILGVVARGFQLVGQAIQLTATAINLLATGLAQVQVLLGIGGKTAQDLAKGVQDVGDKAQETQGKIERINFEKVQGGLSVLDQIKTKEDAASSSADSWAQKLSSLDFSGLQAKFSAAFDSAISDAQNAFDTISGLNWSGLIDTSQWLAAAQQAFIDIQNAAQQAFDFISSLVPSVDFNGIVSAAQQAWNSVVQTVQTAFQSVTSVVQSGISAISNLWSQIKTAASDAFNGIKAAAESALSGVKSIIQGVVNLINDIVSAARAAAAAIASIGSGGGGGRKLGGPVSAFAPGGRVYGAGTGTSDSIPAWLSHGEWVIRAAAVRKYGNQIFALLNSMRLPSDFMERLVGGFAQGGMAQRRYVTSPLRMASGGQVSNANRTVLNLKIGDEQFNGLLAPKDVAERLTRFALNDQIKSGGRKPSWYYGR